MKALELFSTNKAVLCIVTDTTGSCPGRAGFKMAVPASGPCVGSVGGGLLEHSVICLAREMLGLNADAPVLKSFRHSDSADAGERSGMICSGSQTILLVPPPSLNQMTDESKGLRITTGGLEFLSAAPSAEGLQCGEQWSYSEAITAPPVVYIFGGGHCSLALTPVLRSLGLRTVVVDDRQELWTMAENRAAWKRIRADYADAGTIVPDGGESLVVIMTASHVGDALVMEQMLGKNLRYIGMMASRATADHVLGIMRDRGFPEESLERVHTPIGIPIPSHTPAEIAVSIAAEIVQVLNS